jgi:hypothetical protein
MVMQSLFDTRAGHSSVIEVEAVDVEELAAAE